MIAHLAKRGHGHVETIVAKRREEAASQGAAPLHVFWRVAITAARGYWRGRFTKKELTDDAHRPYLALAPVALRVETAHGERSRGRRQSSGGGVAQTLFTAQSRGRRGGRVLLAGHG